MRNFDPPDPCMKYDWLLDGYKTHPATWRHGGYLNDIENTNLNSQLPPAVV